MGDFGPGSKLRPRALMIQLDPNTGEPMGCALHFEVVLPSGMVLTDQQHGWHDVTTADLADCHKIARKAKSAVAQAKELSE